MKHLTCSVAGPMHLGPGELQELDAVIDRLISFFAGEIGIRCFLIPALPGFDAYMAEALYACADRLPGVEVELLVPFRDMTPLWHGDMHLLDRLLSGAHRVVNLYELYPTQSLLHCGSYMRSRADHELIHPNLWDGVMRLMNNQPGMQHGPQ